VAINYTVKALEEVTAPTITVTSAKLGLTASYADIALVVVDDIDMGVYQVADYGDGIQMRYSSPKQSAFFNLEATPQAIVSITVVYNGAKFTAYAPTPLDVYAGTASQQTATTGGTRLSTVLNTNSYTVNFEASSNFTFFKIEKPALSYTAYLTEVIVTLAAPTV